MLSIYDLSEVNDNLTLESTRNNKKEQNIFAIFSINFCVNKFDFACWNSRKFRAIVRNAYLDSAYFNSGFLSQNFELFGITPISTALLKVS